MAINFDDYLISFEIAFQRNLRRSMDRTVVRLRRMPKEIQKQFEKITVGTLVSGGLPVTFRATIKMDQSKWEALAKETEILRDDMFSGEQGSSELGKRVATAVNNVHKKITARFQAAGLNRITGNLAQAMAAQEVVLEEFKTVGIQAATMNIGSLNAGTPPYYRNKKTGEWRIRSETPKDYPATVGGREIPVTGYWGFQQFGTKNGVIGRNFILAAGGEQHAEDDAEFEKVNSWIKTRVEEYNTKAKGIMK